MDLSDGNLREQINGGRAVAPEPKRLRRFDERTAGRRQALRRTGILGVLAVCAASVAAAGLSLMIGGEGDAAPDAHVSVAHGPVVTSLDRAALVSDGGEISRSLPVGLGGRRIPVEAEPATAVSVQPEPLRVPRLAMADGADPDGAIPQGPGRGAAPEAGDGVPAALLVAQSNLVWNRVFTGSGLDYTPLRHAPRTDWREGGCAARAMPDLAAYCPFDQTVYVRSGRLVDALDTLAVANEIGHHVQDMLGVAIEPLQGEARELQADCFAGLWAQNDSTMAESLAPGMVRAALAGGDPLPPWHRRRLDAFTQGYTAVDPRECGTLRAGGAG